MQFFWGDPRPGDKLNMAVPVASAGRYEVKLQVAYAHNCGTFQFYLDGQKLGEPVDLYNKLTFLSGEKPSGEFELSAGEHTLTAEVLGRHPGAVNYQLGLDYVKLEKVKGRK